MLQILTVSSRPPLWGSSIRRMRSSLHPPWARGPRLHPEGHPPPPASLDGFKEKKAVVIVFVDTECPMANLYIPTEIELHRKYAGKGVQFVAINSSSQDLFVNVSAHAQERDVPFPVLKDFDQKVADAFAPSGRARRSCSTPTGSSATTAESTTSTERL